MGKSSSAKKVKRLADQQGKKKARSYRGSVFPITLGVVGLVGLATVVYARGNAGAAESPKVGEHWHVAYGIYTCDSFQPNLTVGQEPDPDGVHSHGDGVIHIHPFNSTVAGDNARLGPWLDQMGIELTDTKLVLPDDPELGLSEEERTFEEGTTKCPEGDDPEIRVLVWDNAVETSTPRVYLTGFDDIRFTNDQMAVTIAFVPKDTTLDETLKPPTASELPGLGAVDDVDPTPTPESGDNEGGSESESTVATTEPASTTATTEASG